MGRIGDYAFWFPALFLGRRALLDLPVQTQKLSYIRVYLNKNIKEMNNGIVKFSPSDYYLLIPLLISPPFDFLKRPVIKEDGKRGGTKGGKQ